MRSTTPTPLVGVAAALQASSDPSFTPKKTLFDEFSLQGRVGVVTGGNRGIGLEMALALCEAGATVYALDLPDSPGEEFVATAEYAKKLGSTLKYVSIDVTDQTSVWDKIKAIGDAEKRVDVCVAAAGILNGADCLFYKAEDFQRIMNVNVNGVLYTAQAAGQQMTRFGTPGSIIPIASISGSATNRDHAWVAYNTSYIYTKMTAAYLDSQPGLEEKWSNLNPLGRIGRPDELRGVTAWLASDASTFCTGSE
ncbi:sorbose reductase, partial [Rhizoctonia solani AG-3 Rhs1AP]